MAIEIICKLNVYVEEIYLGYFIQTKEKVFTTLKAYKVDNAVSAILHCYVV